MAEMEFTEQDEAALAVFALGCRAAGLTNQQTIDAFRAVRPVALQFASRVCDLHRQAINGLGERIGTTTDPWTAGLLSGLTIAAQVVEKGPDVADAVTADTLAQMRLAAVARTVAAS